MVRKIQILLTILVLAFPITALAALTSSTVPVHDHSSAAQGGGALTLSGALSSTKTCTSGYTRTAANYCARNTLTGITAPVSCTAVTMPAADAKVLVIRVKHLLYTNNAVATWTTGVYFATNSACSTGLVGDFLSLREIVATAAGTLLGEGSGMMFLPAGAWYHIQSKNGAPENSTNWFIVGYFD